MSEAHAVEDRIRNSIAEMISAYDLQSAIDRAVKQALMDRIEEDSWRIEKAMVELATALYDIKRIKEVWPDAPTSHLDMF